MLLSKIKNNIQYEVLKFLPDKLFLSYYYKKRTGKKLDFNNPQTFNEKLQYKKLYDKAGLKPTLPTAYDANFWHLLLTHITNDY